MGRKLAYLAEYTGTDGLHHTAVHFYDRNTGIVDMMRDVKFDDGNYPFTDAVLFQHELEDEEWRKVHPRFEVRHGDADSQERFNVFDNERKRVVAIFFSGHDAAEYAEVCNENDMYLDDASQLDEDPFI